MTALPDTPPTDSARPPSGTPWRIAAWSAAVLLLLLPLVAMLFTDEVQWTASDFVFAGVLLFSVGGALELAVRRSSDAAYRWASGLALATTFLMIWANAAVGIIGPEDDSVNVLFLGVLAVGLAGAVLARFRPRGMALAMAATALAQAAVAVGALVAGWVSPATETVELVALWGFVGMWSGSAMLFGRAARGASA